MRATSGVLRETAAPPSSLTRGAGEETDPAFSPDGTQVAFTGEYDGNVDVFVVAAEGGVPKRLTWHPAPDRMVGWTPDGKRIIFATNRSLLALRRVIYGACHRRRGRETTAAYRLPSFDVARRRIDRLRADRPRLYDVEEISRRTDDAHLAGASFRQLANQGAAHEFQ